MIRMRGGAKGLGAATRVGEQKQLGRGQKKGLPGSGLDPYHSRLCQTCLKSAWQELSLKGRKPGSRGKPTERLLSRSAWRLIPTQSQTLPKPTPPTQRLRSQIQYSRTSRSQFSAAAPSPSPGRCASAAALRTPPPFPAHPP